MDKINIANWIRSYEVIESRAYTNSDGHLTIGIDFNLDEVGARERIEGLGANFESVLDGTESLSDTQIEYLFNQDIDHAMTVAHAIFPDLNSYPPDKQIVIVDMLYDLGERGFKKLDGVIDAIKHENWTDASTRMQESLLFNSLSHRATEEINLMRYGYTEPAPSLNDNGSYYGYTDTYYPHGPYYVGSSLNSLDTAITSMHLIDMQNDHPDHHTVVDQASITPSAETFENHSKSQSEVIIPEYNILPYIDSSPHPTPSDIYLITDQHGDPGYASFTDQTSTDLVSGTCGDYPETHPIDSSTLDNKSHYTNPSPHPTSNDIYLVNNLLNNSWNPSVPDQSTTNLTPAPFVDNTILQSMEDLSQSLDPTQLPIADDIYFANDCLNVYSSWQTEDHLRELMGRNDFETIPIFEGSPGLEVYTEQTFPDGNLDGSFDSTLEGGHDFISID